MVDSAPATLETIGQASAKIPIELSTRFLEHFSEQLYSSLQKTFEELISNGWDAGADCVDVRISSNLDDDDATLSVLDNGSSMDEEGLRQLWHIAFSPKKNKPIQHGRHVIGKFGIGKLATYVLASKLTYICKASDGKIRRVTMDYEKVDLQKGTAQDRLISELELDMYEVTDEEVAAALGVVHDGTIIHDLIRGGVRRPTGDLSEDEFGAPKADLQRPSSDTWTLVVLSALKPTGRELKTGVLRRMLEAALPFGSEMAISVNGDLLASSKVKAPLMKEWVLGPELGVDSIELTQGSSESRRATPKSGKSVQLDETEATLMTRLPLRSGTAPFPHVELPDLGRVTGRVWLFEERISGGKSEERGASNGFHVNVLGRVVNQNDPSFGEENLSHAAWARFRMTIRADGLNDYLTTDREKFKERRELKIFRAFLRRVFNVVRNYYDNEKVELPDGGDALVKSLGVLSLNPLRNVVSETLETQPPIHGLFDETGITDRGEKRRSWRDNTADNIKNALGQVKYERIEDGTFVKFRIADSTIIVNRDHPFVAEYSKTRAEKELIRTIAMVNLLSDVYALDIGVQPSALESIREYRDLLMRYRAMQSRQSGIYIARLLLQTQNNSSNSRLFEIVLSDALRYLGFHVKDLAKPGEPEGIASAYAMPTLRIATLDNPTPPLYSFSFDAKSSKNDVASTGNIKLDGVVEHRERYRADHALVVAPGFSDGALATRCAQQKVTPMMARDLGKLLEYTVKYGAIPVTKLREVFQMYDPKSVTSWVVNLESYMAAKRVLTIDVFLKALDNLKGKIPDALPAATIALVCRESMKIYGVRDDDVVALAKGLAILIPDLIGIDADRIIVNASSARIAAAVAAQLEQLHEEGLVGNSDNDGPAVE